jgi:peroxiredoxin (alkyl hydroperoxide reductase subunit C)
VIAASTDSVFTHLAWVNTPRADGGLGEMKIPILADFDKKVATSYGVLLPDGVPLRALFLIDPKGTLRQVTVNDLPVGRNVDEIVRLVKALQFVEEHGEVCPANWQPGAKTLVPDSNKAKEYFKGFILSLSRMVQFLIPTFSVFQYFFSFFLKNIYIF